MIVRLRRKTVLATTRTHRLRCWSPAHPGGAAADARHLPAQSGRQISDLCLRRASVWCCAGGYAGILSLGQGVFFGLGGYCMAMFLKLEASSVANTKIQSTPGIPDFMDWNQITELPLFWVPFKSLPFTLLAVIVVPTLAGLYRRRGDVQAPRRRRLLRDHHPGARRGADDPDHRAAGLHRRHQRHHRPEHAARLGHPHRQRKYILYFVCCVLLLGTMFLARFVLASKLGRILVAMRDKEDRVRFSGYDVANFKIFVFCLAAGHGGDRRRDVHPAGRLHVAVLRRHRAVDRDGDLLRGRRPASVVGAVVGTLLVNWGKTVSRRVPGVVAVRHGRPVHRGGAVRFPRGLAGLVTDQLIPRLAAGDGTAAYG